MRPEHEDDVACLVLVVVLALWAYGLAVIFKLLVLPLL